MKKSILILFIAICGFSSAQKEQDADTLIWNGRRYAMVVEPYVPSVLMVYYQCSGKTSPFTFWSSNNNRGHVATYEILNDALYLRNVEAKRYRTRLGNLWTESGIDTVVTPDFFEISSIDSSQAFSPDMVLTDWFSGCLKLKYLPTTKKELKQAETKGYRFLTLKNGRIVGNTFISDDDLKRFDAGIQGSEVPRDMLEQYRLYVAFFSRCAMDRERVAYNSHEGLFERKTNSLPLAMLPFGNDAQRYFDVMSDGKPTGAAPFGDWLIRNDSLFLSAVNAHLGSDIYSFSAQPLQLDKFIPPTQDSGIVRNAGVPLFAHWVSGDFVIHYGSWDTSSLGIPSYTVAKTQKIRFSNGVVTLSQFSPSSFDDDGGGASLSSFAPCKPTQVFSVDDKLLAEAVGNFKSPKKNPEYEGGKSTFRSWFLNHPLTDERAKDRLFRVHLAFMVNCNGEVGQWQVISKGKGELFEFANMVLELVKTMPQNWQPATDRKGNPVDCWQKMEFTVSNGVLTNGNYK